MFNLGFQELALIFIIALIFIGPKQLPEMAKNLGRLFRDFKRTSNEITDSLQREARDFNNMKDELKADLDKDLDQPLLESSETEKKSLAESDEEFEPPEPELESKKYMDEDDDISDSSDIIAEESEKPKNDRS